MANVAVNATISARDAASKNIKTVNKALGTLGKTAGSIGADFKKLALGIGGVLAAAGAFTVAAIKEAAAGQAETAKLNAALKARGLATASVAAAIERQIVAGQKLAFSDGEVRASVEASTRFTKKYSDAVKIQNAAFDLSRATGMSLEEATIALGKAYQGNGAKLFGMLGIQNKGLTGIKAINAILRKTKGSATAYADTLAGSFSVLTVGVNKLKGDFGSAFLPALTKLFKGLAPYIEKFANTIKANTPQLEKWADVIVTKILDNLPRLFREFQRLVPRALKSIEGFVDKITGIGKSADDLLGPGGSITLLVTGIGAAFGGLKGAITANLVKDGMDPFTALIVANIAAQIPASLASALTGAIVNQAIAAYGAKMTAATVAANAVPGGPSGGSLFNFAAIGAALKTFGTKALAFIPAVVGTAAATGGAGVFPMFDPNVPGSLTGPDGPLGFLNQSGNDKTKNWNALFEKYRAMGVTDSNAYKAVTYEQGLKYDIESYVTAENKAAYDKIAAGFGLAFSTPYGSTNSPMEAKYTSNIYIGTGKVDTVISESLQRIQPSGGRGQ
jgi:hypothetical protein